MNEFSDSYLNLVFIYGKSKTWVKLIIIDQRCQTEQAAAGINSLSDSPFYFMQLLSYPLV